MTNNAVATLDPRGIMAAISKRPPREYVDFDSVLPEHKEIDRRLSNWARWCRGSHRQWGSGISPMFRLYRSSDARRDAYGELTDVGVDRLDAVQVHKAVTALPEKHRLAAHWFYLHPHNPKGAAATLGVSMHGLAELIRDGRQMLINWRV